MMTCQKITTQSSDGRWDLPYKDMNKATASYGQGARFDTTLIVAACTAWLCYGVCYDIFTLLTVFFIEPSTGETLRNMLWSIVFCGFTVAMLWVIRKNVLDFIDIKINVAK